MHFDFPQGPYLLEAPVIIDKPDIVYVIENQSVTIPVTLNHVNAAVIWKRYVCLWVATKILNRLRLLFSNKTTVLCFAMTHLFSVLLGGKAAPLRTLCVIGWLEWMTDKHK